MADKSVEECVPKDESNVSEVTPETQYNDTAIVESANADSADSQVETAQLESKDTELKELKEELSKVDNNINEIQSALEELDKLESKNVEQTVAEQEETKAVEQDEKQKEEEEQEREEEEEEEEEAEEEEEQEEEEEEEEQEEEEEEVVEDKLPHLQIVIKQQQEVPGLITYTFTLLMLVYAFKAFVLLCDFMNGCGKNCVCLSS